MTTRGGASPPAETGTGRRGIEDGRSQLDETKHAPKTTEFWTFVGLLIALLIAGIAIDGFDAGRVWQYITILAVGYMVSRGIAKSQRGRGRGDETKDSVKTTEFVVFVGTLLGLLIAGAVSEGGSGGETDTLEGAQVWLYATILGVGYMVSRGLAKSGAGAAANDHGGGGGGGATVGERMKAAADAFSGSEGGSGPAGTPGGGRGPGTP
ncbi:MAG: hypothetical protein AVDCRST_MAG45-631 [uncultured Solirubrobacterales bacterium]|uniref:Uncharacterized protein n=1 Tax=uncultured Solirubrobacterales bacterium TaxID=768556 RepID=A0A6J4S3Y6_9ACTN|nr:MAG: hypothetical protein AVDCRST_MAG45-631 [uncultured Solirubrobacterales bacterium]